METFGNNLGAIDTENEEQHFYCKMCDYSCSKKYNFDRHILTSKHNKMVNGNKMETKNEQNEQNEHIDTFTCNCGKNYKHRSGLWKHQTKCKYNPSQLDGISTKELVLLLFKQNNELQHSLIEATKQNSVTHNTTTNSHNKTNNSFNLQFFLNETCKNAMNMTQFVDSIKLQLSDLISVGELGYIEGISNIIVKNLTALDITERPVHCTDKKRETFYIKDEDRWEKDEDDKKNMRKIIKKIAYKNENLLHKYKEKYPDYNDSDSIHSDQYSKIIIESYGVFGDNFREKEDKIIKNISKAIVLNKHTY
jgi:hypothetical protein